MVLHQLCHLLNEIAEAYVVPMPRGSIINWLNIDHIDQLVAAEKPADKFQNLPSLNTPIFSSYPGLDLEACVAVYPEVVLGNPLNEKRSTMGALSQWFSSRYESCTSFGEVEFKYNQTLPALRLANFSETADFALKVTMVDDDTYNNIQSNCNMSREELIADRKG